MSPEKEEGEMKKTDNYKGGSIGIILRYADWIDVVLMLMGALGAIGDGLSTNVLLLFASRIMNSLGHKNNQQTSMTEVEKVSSSIC